MNENYCEVRLRDPDGTLRTYQIPTYAIPESFYNREYIDHLQQTDLAAYVEYMHEVDEEFIARRFGG